MKRKNASSDAWPVKRRITGVVAILVMVVIDVGSVFMACDILSEWMTWPPVITFQYGIVFVLLIPVFILFFIIMLVPPVFLKKEASSRLNEVCIKGMFAIMVGWIPVEICVYLIYSHEMERRGYVRCSGIPSGYTPGRGGATRYALDLTLCRKK
jgi:putative copper export protein